MWQIKGQAPEDISIESGVVYSLVVGKDVTTSLTITKGVRQPRKLQAEEVKQWRSTHQWITGRKLDSSAPMPTPSVTTKASLDGDLSLIHI